MSLPIVLKRKLIGASINFLFIFICGFHQKKIPQDQPTNQEVDYKCKVPVTWYCYLQSNIPTSESHRHLQNVIVGTVEGPLWDR